MVNKDTKRCLTSLETCERKINTTIKRSVHTYHIENGKSDSSVLKRIQSNSHYCLPPVGM